MKDMTREEWKHIKGYEGLYEISTFGRVRKGNRYINPWVQYGYMYVGLWKGKKCKKFRVHRLVAETFIPNPNSFTSINHIDEDKSNNCVTNLEWCTTSYNNAYGNRGAKMLHTYKQRNTSNAEKEVLQLSLYGEIVNEYKSISEASRQTGLSLGNLSSVCNNKPHRKTLGGYKWRFRKAMKGE